MTAFAATRSRLLAQPVHLFWVYLALVGVAEYLTAVVNPLVGLGMHALLLLGLSLLSGLAGSPAERRLWLALTLAPLIRLLSLSLPLPRMPQVAWYPAVALPLLLAAWLVIRQTRVTRRQIGLTLDNIPLQLGLSLTGLALGTLEYMILRPAPLPEVAILSGFLLAALSLFIFTGFSEELIFRGLMQSLALPVLARWALIYVSLLFGLLHIGHLAWVDIVFVALVGLLFAQIVRWSGSIFGVSLAHGLTNITLFLVLPVLNVSVTPALFTYTVWGFLTVGVLSGVIVVSIIQLRASVGAPPIHLRSGVVQPLRRLRRDQGRSYADIAQHTGIALHRIIEIEMGFCAAEEAELQRIAEYLVVDLQLLQTSVIVGGSNLQNPVAPRADEEIVFSR